MELGARARVKFYIFHFSRIGYAPYRRQIGCVRRVFYFSRIGYAPSCQKKKVATGKSGARADPHQYITARSPKGFQYSLSNSACSLATPRDPSRRSCRMFGWRGSPDFSAHRYFYAQAAPPDVALGGSEWCEPPRATLRRCCPRGFRELERNRTP